MAVEGNFLQILKSNFMTVVEKLQAAAADPEKAKFIKGIETQELLSQWVSKEINGKYIAGIHFSTACELLEERRGWEFDEFTGDYKPHWICKEIGLRIYGRTTFEETAMYEHMDSMIYEHIPESNPQARKKLCNVTARELEEEADRQTPTATELANWALGISEKNNEPIKKVNIKDIPTDSNYPF